jgi:hypothetical protein
LLAESVVCKNIITLGKKLEVGVHLIDPIELSWLVMNSKNKDNFWQLLDHRWFLSSMKRTVHFKYQD